MIRRGAGIAIAPGMLIDAAFNELTINIIGAAIEVHRQLGPGLLESTYLPCLQFELSSRQFDSKRSGRFPLPTRVSTWDRRTGSISSSSARLSWN